MTIRIGDKEYILEGYAYEGVLRKVLSEVYKQGITNAIDKLMGLLPDCDKIEIEHLIYLMEEVKKND